MAGERTQFETSDGRTLTGHWFRPRRKPRETLVIHGATGLLQRFYRHFAAWLAEERDIACLTYDYRDFGASLDGDIRRSKARFSDWGLRDQPAALAEAVARSATGRVRVLGHSLGGLFLNRPAQADRIDHATAIGAGEGHFLAVPPMLAPASFAFWFGHGPMLTMSFGYLPGQYSGFGVDLPAGVFWEWRRWCVEPAYGRRVTPPAAALPKGAKPFPIRLIGAKDDPLIRPQGVWRLGGDRYQGHPLEKQVLDPQDLGLKRIGHVGAFDLANAAAWPSLVDRAA